MIIDCTYMGFHTDGGRAAMQGTGLEIGSNEVEIMYVGNVYSTIF